jgi:hypothetical protein
MRTLKSLLIVAVALSPCAAIAQTSAVQRTYVKPHTAGRAVGIPGIASPGSISWIVPLRTEDVMQAEASGGGG